MKNQTSIFFLTLYITSNYIKTQFACGAEKSFCFTSSRQKPRVVFRQEGEEGTEERVTNRESSNKDRQPALVGNQGNTTDQKQTSRLNKSDFLLGGSPLNVEQIEQEETKLDSETSEHPPLFSVSCFDSPDGTFLLRGVLHYSTTFIQLSTFKCVFFSVSSCFLCLIFFVTFTSVV